MTTALSEPTPTTTPTTTLPAPARPAWTTRIVGVDVARFVALLGMIAAHLYTTANGNPDWTHHLTSGRPAALFAVLAGVSVALLTGGARRLDADELATRRRQLAVRGVLIMLIGLTLGLVTPPIAIILTVYGVMFLAVTAFVGLRRRTLLVLAAAWLVLAPLLSHAFRLLTAPHAAGGTGIPDGVTVFENPSFATLAHPFDTLAGVTLYGTYPAFTWFAYVLVGLAVGRLDLRSGWIRRRLVAVGAVLTALPLLLDRAVHAVPHTYARLAGTFDPAAPLGPEEFEAMTQSGSGLTPVRSWWWELTTLPHSGSVMDLATTTGSALLVLGAALVVTRRAPRIWWIACGAGAMTLTIYTLHVLSTWSGLRAPGQLGFPTWYLPVTVGAAVLLGVLFRLLGRSGPLESLVTALSRATAASWPTAGRTAAPARTSP